ncbi:MAG: MFS transporter [Anaerolineales bacterium]|jgi:MFS family permease
MANSKLNPRIQGTFAALRHRNYQLWFYGQMVSLMGTWMQSTAQGYLIYQLTNSPVYLGLVGFAAGIPTWLFTLFGGVVADRISRRNLMVITQSAMLVLAFILAALAFTNAVQPWHILVLAFLLGVANAFDAPARASFVLELVPREDMTNAIALNSTMFNIATVVGPSIAGLTYAAFGPAWCFTLNGLSFIAVIVALLLMHIKMDSQQARRPSAITEIVEGLQYVFTNRLVLSLTATVGLVAMFGFGLMNLLPAWATDVLHGNEVTNGLLVSARGLGALISALMLASLTKHKVRGRLWMAGYIVVPVSLFLFAWIRWLPLSLTFLVVVGSAMMMLTNNSNALIQSGVPDNLRGRVMGVYTLVFNGFIPIGALLAGGVAQKLGSPVTVMLSAGVLLIFVIATWIFLPEIRRQE